MTATTIRVQMAQRKDTAANWTAANPILLSGEIGYETDTKKFKIGNGSSNWNSLAYLPIPDGSGNLTITGNLEIGSTGDLQYWAGGSSNGIHRWFTSGSERARIDSSGRLLVGTTPSAQGDGLLQVKGLGNTPKLTMWRDNAPFGFIDGTAGSSIEFGASPSSGVFGIGATIQFFGDQTWGSGDYPGRLVFSTTADGASSPTERMRISQNGNTLWRSDGTTSTHDLGNSNTSITGEVVTFSAYRNTVNDTFKFLTCVRQGFAVALEIRDDGDIYNVNGTYGSLSDAKLKENIVDANSQWDDIKQLRVRNYNFKPETNNSTHKQIGVIAQEIEDVSPGLVNTVPDRDAEGNDLGTVTKSVNYSVLYMKAVKALQEAMERIEQLEAKVSVLESKP